MMGTDSGVVHSTRAISAVSNTQERRSRNRVTAATCSYGDPTVPYPGHRDIRNQCAYAPTNFRVHCNVCRVNLASDVVAGDHCNFPDVQLIGDNIDDMKANSDAVTNRDVKGRYDHGRLFKVSCLNAA